MGFSYISALLILSTGLAAAQDLTRLENAFGPDVVDAVVNLIRELCIFPNDRLLLRRFALAETSDGRNASTYRAGFDGGIWGVTQNDFQAVQANPALSTYFTQISNHFGINWKNVQWHDLRKPLYSGLAAALLFVQKLGENVPPTSEAQAAWYQKEFHPNDVMAAYNFNLLAQSYESTCDISLLDLAFVVDSSSTINPVDYETAKRFAIDIVQAFNVSSNNVRVALITFSTGYKAQFNFKTYSDKASVQAAIKAVTKIEGDTDTQLALEFATNELFTPDGGSRSSASKVVILLTDGKATRHEDAIQRAKELRDKGVSIFAIGVGNQVEHSELDELASTPTCTHVQLLKNYQDLDALKVELEQLSCKTPVTLLPGRNNSFPCGTTNNFKINVNGSVTSTIHSTIGLVEIFGSFLNPYPSAAFNEFTTSSNNSRPAIVYVKNETRPLFLTVVSHGADPSTCNFGTYDINIEEQSPYTSPDAKTTCILSGIIRECTPLDILYANFIVAQPSPLEFPNPCQPGHRGYLSHPLSYTKFIYCEYNGDVYVVECPAGTWFNERARWCVHGIPPTFPPTSSPAPTLQPPMRTNQPDIGNPCTVDAINRGTYYFPYPPDPTKYIHCAEWPGFGVLQDCAQYHRWSQPHLACIYIGTVVNHTVNIFLTSPHPLDVNCTPGLKESDLFYHPYPGDRTKFIQCDQYGDAFVKDCPTGKVWNQAHLGCFPSAQFTTKVPVGK